MEREVGGGIGMGNTCKPMVVSFQCMTKFTTNKKKKKKNGSHSHCEGFRLFLCLSLSFPHIPFHNRLFEPVVTDYLKTDLVHTPVLIAYSGYLEPNE